MATEDSDWKGIEELFHAALERPAAERDRWLAKQPYPATVLSEVASLLEGLRTHEELSEAPKTREEPAPESPESPSASARFGPYQTERLLGRGGMGAVYLARRVDGQFDQTVALKVMAGHLAGNAALKRFQTERQLLARLNHPHVTKLLDGGVNSSGDPYLVMEYVQGRTLDRYCDEQKLSVEERLRLFLQVCEAVDYAHRNLVLHRDLKPGNILVEEAANGGSATAKLLDFGTASLMADGIDLTITMTRQFTPRYASPEELRGERANTSSDIFSLGVILYELLTGAWPFGNIDSMFSEMNRALRDVAVKQPSTAATEEAAENRATSRDHLARLLQGDLSSITLKALEGDPARRYGTVRQFADDIEAYLEGRPVQAHQQTPFYRASKFLRRRWLPVAVGAAFALSLSAATIVAVRQVGVARAEAVKAERVNDFLNSMLSSASLQGFDPQRYTVVQMLEASEPLIERNWKSDPLAKATIQLSLGSSFTTLHRLDRARPLLESALATFRARGDEKEIVLALEQLADNSRETGEVEKGANLFDEALKHVKHMGKQAPPFMVFRVESGLASLLTLYLNRRLPEAESLFDDAIAIGNRDSSIPRTALAIVMTRRAGMMRGEAGKQKESEATMVKALAIGRQEDPGGTWEIVPLYELALLHRRMQDFAGARDFAHQLYDTWTRHVGPDDESSVNALAFWAMNRAETGEITEAIQQIRTAVPLLRKTYGPGNLNLWTPLSAATRIFNTAGRFGEAEPYARELLEVVEAGNLPEVDARRAEALAGLGEALHGQAKHVEAVQKLQRALVMYRQLGSTRNLEHVQKLLDEEQPAKRLP